VSRIGPKFMNEMYTIEITEEHEVIVGSRIKTKSIKVHKRESTGNSTEETLYERLTRLKHHYDCSFNFNINNKNDIAIGAVLPSGFIFELLMIPCVQPVTSLDGTSDKYAYLVHNTGFTKQEAELKLALKSELEGLSKETRTDSTKNLLGLMQSRQSQAKDLSQSFTD
jgi:hypothetical protein